MSNSKLIVLGAGPKALAIAAKRKVLKELGWSVPDLIVVDKSDVAAHWSGNYGFTDGKRFLGTPPEKDVGYPYASTAWGSSNQSVNRAMTAFSWQNFLIDSGGYAEWVDRRRPQPFHGLWAAYFRWVADAVGLDVRIGEVSRISVVNRRWQLSCRREDTEFTVEGDGLVITGPGVPLTIPGQPENHERIFDGSSFWKSESMTTFKQLPPQGQRWRIAIIGAGETAAAVAVALNEILPVSCLIELIISHGVPYSRGESFEENKLFSNPGHIWSEFSEDHRREFIKRTDRGVFSVDALNALSRANNILCHAGKAAKMPVSDGNRIVVDVNYGDRGIQNAYDYVILAIGFDPLWFSGLFDDAAFRRLSKAINGGAVKLDTIEHFVEGDLSLNAFAPRLHLPIFAALTQGPGFPNLSCLGLLSDRILSTYCTT